MMLEKRILEFLIVRVTRPLITEPSELKLEGISTILLLL